VSDWARFRRFILPSLTLAIFLVSLIHSFLKTQTVEDAVESQIARSIWLAGQTKIEYHRVLIDLQHFVEDDATRGAFYVMLLGGAAVWVLAWRRLKRPAGTIVVDERDRAIQARSFTVESVLVIVSLVAWTVALTEVFWHEGAVPLGYLQLIFWSTFIAGAFGRALGVVLGYRREPSADA